MITSPEHAPVLPYPHGRNDCDLCREKDADFEIVEDALNPPNVNGRTPRRFCQDCIGRWMATMAMTCPGHTPQGQPWSVSVLALRPDGQPW